jgi:formamidopyrimidine-DNA glycosylase
MPELPEVETIRRGLEKCLKGRVVENIEALEVKQFHGDPDLVIGARIVGVRRFGKGLVIDFENGFSLVIHLKMTGQLIYALEPRKNKMLAKAGGDVRSKHTRVIFHLDKGGMLCFNDIRKFGWIRIVESDKVMNLPFFRNLGPEPAVTKDSGDRLFLSLEKFAKILRKTKMPIKNVLTDQTRIAGIGNIYANDALYVARINPLRAGMLLSGNEIKRLFDAIESVLKKGIAVGGASERNYVNVLGKKGGYQNFFQVYGKAGKKCNNCKCLIERMKIGGRGTFFCAGCQK